MLFIPSFLYSQPSNTEYFCSCGDKRSYLHLHTNCVLCVVSLTCILGLACSSSGLRGMPTVWTGIQRVTTSAFNQALR